jgi:hypothetical protein
MVYGACVLNRSLQLPGVVGIHNVSAGEARPFSYVRSNITCLLGVHLSYQHYHKSLRNTEGTG